MIFATSNPHKVEEARAILAPLGIDLKSLVELGCNLPEPEEDGATFEDNARLKARNDALDAEVRDLKEGSDALEERARLELGMIKRDEVFYQVVQAKR